MCIYAHIYMYIYLYIYLYIYTYNEQHLNAVGKRHDAAHKVSQRRAAHKLLEKRQQPQFVRGMRNLQILCRVVAQQRCKLELH